MLNSKSMPAVSVDKITKKYAGIEALKGVSLEVERGELYGIIGPDGAGKTSLFRILTTLLLPDSGSAKVAGLDVVKDYKRLRSLIGYMPGRFSLYQDLSVEENLNFFATLFNTTVKENYHLIRDIYIQIEPFRTRRAGALSGGMKQKLALCCALIHKPEVLFLDEPTTGVDPVSRKEFWQMLARLKEQGISILVSTPYMDEAKRCDRIALIREGSFLKIDAPEAIIESYTDILWSVVADDMYRLLRDLRKHPLVKSCFAFGDVHHITVEPGLSPDALKEYLLRNAHTAIGIEAIRPNIEDCYMKLAIT